MVHPWIPILSAREVAYPVHVVRLPTYLQNSKVHKHSIFPIMLKYINPHAVEYPVHTFYHASTNTTYLYSGYTHFYARSRPMYGQNSCPSLTNLRASNLN